jgi:hypothetical protein
MIRNAMLFWNRSVGCCLPCSMMLQSIVNPLLWKKMRFLCGLSMVDTVDLCV